MLFHINSLVYGANPNAATAAAMYRFLCMCDTTPAPLAVVAGVSVLRYASVAKPTPELMASETTGVMPLSKRTFHCVARVGAGAWRSAGRVITVVLMFVPIVDS